MAFIKNGQGSSLGVVEAPKAQPNETESADKVSKPVEQVVRPASTKEV